MPRQGGDKGTLSTSDHSQQWMAWGDSSGCLFQLGNAGEVSHTWGGSRECGCTEGMAPTSHPLRKTHHNPVKLPKPAFA